MNDTTDIDTVRIDVAKEQPGTYYCMRYAEEPFYHIDHWDGLSLFELIEVDKTGVMDTTGLDCWSIGRLWGALIKVDADGNQTVLAEDCYDP